MTKILSNWNEAFEGCEPIGHLLRKTLPERWVRFHSLPSSKRYPDDEAEYAILLQRHSRILAELAGTDHNLVLLTTCYSESPTAEQPDPELETLAPGALLWRTIAKHELGPILSVEFPGEGYFIF